MIVLAAQNVNKYFGEKQILKDINFSLQDGEKMGLVGVNGCGKTTLFKIIASIIKPDEGSISINKDMQLAYLEQNTNYDQDCSVYEAMLEIFQEAINLKQRLETLEHLMSIEKDEKQIIKLSAEYNKKHDRFLDIEGYAYEGEIKSMLNGLGFNEEDMHKRISQFSGGEKTRIYLAKMLLQKPDIILLDEPTNHLDIQSISWLENYLQQYKGSMIIVSHDRYFLDKVCTSTAEISMGKMRKYEGAYSEFQKKRDAILKAEIKAYELQQKHIEREKEIIAQYRQYNREKSIKAAESRQKRLDKLEVLELPQEERHIKFSFKAAFRSGDQVLRGYDLTKYYGERKLFEGLNFEVKLGDRIALIGKNGIGKSSLFDIISKNVPPDKGYVELGSNVDIGYYDQQHKSLDNDKTVLDNVWDFFPKMAQHEVRNALGTFLFSGDDVFKKADKLSGGERGRVLLTKLMLDQNNLLLLDEPTNHLDADSCEALEEALSNYDGTIIAISHDRYFINKFANKIFVMSEDGMEQYLGNYDDYIEKINAPKKQEQDSTNKTKLYKQNRLARDEKRKLKELKETQKSLEKELLSCEDEYAKVELELSNPDIYKDNTLFESLHARYKNLAKRQEEIYDELELLEEEINNMQN